MKRILMLGLLALSLLCGTAFAKTGEGMTIWFDTGGSVGDGYGTIVQNGAKAAAAEAGDEDKQGDCAAAATLIKALPSPRAPRQAKVDLKDWQHVTARPEDEIVIVSIGELGPWGSGRTRFEAELGIHSDGKVDLSAGAVLELAWNMGLLTWNDSPKPGWYDTDGNLVPEEDIAERYHDEVVARSGVRPFEEGMGNDYKDGADEEEAEVVEAAVDYDDEELMDKMQKAARLLRSRRFAISKEEEAKAAGADYVGLDEYVEKIKGGWTDVDVIITTPNVMGKVGALGRILGPRGLMPNPKTGTVTMDVAKAVSEVKAGKIDFKVDKFGIVHTSIGKVSFSPEQIVDNANEFLSMIMKLKPSAAKGSYVKSIYLSSTMSPGLQIDAKSVETK